MATDWEERSEIDYDAEHMNHPRRRTEEQLVSVMDWTSTPAGGLKHTVVVKSRDANAQTSNRPSKRTELLFQRVKDTNKKYRPIKQKVVSESQHTLTLANGSVLRKSGVAGKALNPNARKISESVTPKPPTMSAVRRRADLKRAQEEQAAGISARKTNEAGTRSKLQNWDYEDEADSDSEYESLRVSRYAGQNEDEPTAGPSQGDASNAPSAKDNTEGVAETSGGSGAQASKGVDSEIQTTGTGQGGSAHNLNREAQPGKLPEKKGERFRRQRLLSYSSQGSQDSDGEGSRKSSRKRTAVTQIGEVMIDRILKTRKNKGEVDRERDTN